MGISFLGAGSGASGAGISPAGTAGVGDAGTGGTGDETADVAPAEAGVVKPSDLSSILSPKTGLGDAEGKVVGWSNIGPLDVIGGTAGKGGGGTETGDADTAGVGL